MKKNINTFKLYIRKEMEKKNQSKGMNEKATDNKCLNSAITFRNERTLVSRRISREESAKRVSTVECQIFKMLFK